ncbi:MAG TPA: polysaccharide biosynthesis/export family protein, partial [Gemmatimonadales bacterium]|nr:polysaccharide biosynthesis/export family protein [Gemmatimonadales bacterium]
LSPEQRTYAEAVALRNRLDQGDFQVGDRVVIHVRGDTALSDTFTVTPKRSLELPNIGEVSLAGVLRSELEDHLRETISRYVRQLDLKAESLVRLSILGQIGRPGVYNVSSAALLGDVFSAGGGLTPTSDVGRSLVNRGGVVFLTSKRLEAAITEGRTIDQLNLHSGDELLVAEKKRGEFANTIIIIGAVAGAVLSIVAVVSLLK